MMGFWVTVAAMAMTAWIVYAATYRAAYMQGRMDERRDIVPAGTQPCYPQDCDSECPHSVTQLPRSRVQIPMPPVRAPRADCFPPGCNEFPECDHRY